MLSDTLVSYEMTDMYSDFLRYMPKEVEVFSSVESEIQAEEYMLLTWCDACPFVMEGVPVFMNDAAYEQIYENTSSYIGRDHTNKDDMSIYSKETHLTASWWYGCLGVYLDNMPVLMPDFSVRAQVMRLADEEKTLLEKENLDYSAFEKELKSFELLGDVAAKLLKNFNRKEKRDFSKDAENKQSSFRDTEKSCRCIRWTYYNASAYASGAAQNVYRKSGCV